MASTGNLLTNESFASELQTVALQLRRGEISQTQALDTLSLLLKQVGAHEENPIEEVVVIAVLGEENVYKRMYAVRVKDLPGGNLTDLKEQIKDHSFDGKGKWYRAGVEIPKPSQAQWMDESEEESALQGDIINGFLKYKAFWHVDGSTPDSCHASGFEPSATQRLVYCDEVFEEI